MGESEFTRAVLRLHLEKPYAYRGNGWQYAPLFFAYHGRTDTEFVVYVGLDHLDEGKHFVCELADWEQRFKLIETTIPVSKPEETGGDGPPVPQPGLQKVAGTYTSGSGF